MILCFIMQDWMLSEQFLYNIVYVYLTFVWATITVYTLSIYFLFQCRDVNVAFQRGTTSFGWE